MSVDISKTADAKELKVDIWFGTRENVAAIRFEYYDLKLE